MAYYIPRNVKGESRILFVFSIKALIYTAVGAGIGILFYMIFSMLSLTTVGIIFVVLLGGIGFCIGTFKIPDTEAFDMTRKTGGENIDDVILRYVKFKTGKKRLYAYVEEVKKDGE